MADNLFIFQSMKMDGLSAFFEVINEKINNKGSINRTAEKTFLNSPIFLKFTDTHIMSAYQSNYSLSNIFINSSLEYFFTKSPSRINFSTAR